MEKISNFSPEGPIEAQVHDWVGEAVEETPVDPPWVNVLRPPFMFGNQFSNIYKKHIKTQI